MILESVEQGPLIWPSVEVEGVPPPTIPSIILENLPTFNSAFCFEER
nr:hypothetical protein [Tanacetum cinerariifolium]